MCLVVAQNQNEGTEGMYSINELHLIVQKEVRVTLKIIYYLLYLLSKVMNMGCLQKTSKVEVMDNKMENMKCVEIHH